MYGRAFGFGRYAPYYYEYMLRLIFLILLLLSLLIGGYFLLSSRMPAGEVTPPGDEKTDEETLEVVLARVPGSPIKVDTDQARWPWDEIDGERDFLQKTFTQPMGEILMISEALLTGLERNEEAWCDPYSNASFRSQASGVSWDSQYVKQLVEDTRGERAAQHTIELEKQYESWSMWLVALNEQVQMGDDKRLKKAVKQFQKNFEKITDAYDEDMDTAIQTVNQSFDAVYTKRSQSLKDPRAVGRALGTALAMQDEQTTCPNLMVLSSGERGRIKTGIERWQVVVQADIRNIQAGEAESVRLATQAVARFREEAVQHESDFDAAKSLLMRSLTEKE